MQAADTLTYAVEFAIIGFMDDGRGGAPSMQVITPSGFGKLSGKHDLTAMFDEQPAFNFNPSAKVIGAWFRPRISALPMSFSDATLARFTADTGRAVTRELLREGRNALLDPWKSAKEKNPNLTVDKSLVEKYLESVKEPIKDYQDYTTWWFGKRRDFLTSLRDYLRAEVNPDAVVLYTADATECGKPYPNSYSRPDVVTDDLSSWEDEVSKAISLEQALSTRLHYNALTKPVMPYSGYEWDHSVPPPDPANYRQTPGVMMTHSFNRVYTTSDPASWEAFTTPDGLAAIRHFCLNEDKMADDRLKDNPDTKHEKEDQMLGYFVADMELAGPYSMMPEARALAFGNPRYIGYLSSNNFTRGFPQYARAFNANFLALPALPADTLSGATSDSEVIVRRINTPKDGTWLAIINTGFSDKIGVTVNLPRPGTVTNAVTGSPMPVNGGQIRLNLYPAQLVSVRIQ
jgi:hypothetical protein